MAILNGFINLVPNHWALGFNCVFSKFTISRIDRKVKGLPCIIVVNVGLEIEFIIWEPSGSIMDGKLLSLNVTDPIFLRKEIKGLYVLTRLN